LAHRSQKDPLIADETAPQRVLVPINQSGGSSEGAIAGTSKSKAQNPKEVRFLVHAYMLYPKWKRE